MSNEDGDDRRPIEEVLPGRGIHQLDDGWNAVDACLLIKCLDDEGQVRWVYRTTAPPNREELLGALVVHVDLLRRELLDEWVDED